MTFPRMVTFSMYRNNVMHEFAAALKEMLVGELGEGVTVTVTQTFADAVELPVEEET
ncbi:MAG: hypothetical protein IKR65_05935 [Selenomonadaceae bacterium]|nr:hypothetical protein [Selenomonadaceae bacterium]